MTAIRQEASRHHPGWSLEYVSLSTRVTKFASEEVHEAISEGILIHGLFIQAASWDKRIGRIVEARPKQLFDVMPVLHITAKCDLDFETLKLQQQKVAEANAAVVEQNNNSAAPNNLSAAIKPPVRHSILRKWQTLFPLKLHQTKLFSLNSVRAVIQFKHKTGS